MIHLPYVVYSIQTTPASTAMLEITQNALGCTNEWDLGTAINRDLVDLDLYLDFDLYFEFVLKLVWV